MKKLLLFVGFLLFMSCEKFLDAPQATDGFNLQVVFSSSSTIRAYFNGIYSRIRSFNGGGIGSLINTRNVLGKDVIGVLSRRTAYAYFASSLLDRGEAINPWVGFYSLIDQTNVILHNLPNAGVAEDEKVSFEAEAKALRAYFYFELLLHYAPAYVIGASEPSVPIYMTPSTITTEGSPRSTVQEVYDLILEDLQFALTGENFSYDRSNKAQFSRAVIEGILARVYLHMGEWEKAQDMAMKAGKIQIAGTSITSDPPLDGGEYGIGFGDASAREWMWANISNLSEPNGFAALWSEERGSPMLIDEDFIALLRNYSDSEGEYLDIRAQTVDIWIDEIDDEPIQLGVKEESFVSSKFRFSWTNDLDFPLMRISEMYLIAAECFARLGNLTQAGLLLKALQADRAPAATLQDIKTQQGLIDTVLIERRKELYGEGLADWLDHKRLNLPLERGDGHLFGTEGGTIDFRYTVPENSPCYYFPIPSDEILYNSHINDQLPLCDRNIIQ